MTVWVWTHLHGQTGCREFGASHVFLSLFLLSVCLAAYLSFFSFLSSLFPFCCVFSGSKLQFDFSLYEPKSRACRGSRGRDRSTAFAADRRRRDGSDRGTESRGRQDQHAVLDTSVPPLGWANAESKSASMNVYGNSCVHVNGSLFFSLSHWLALHFLFLLFLFLFLLFPASCFSLFDPGALDPAAALNHRCRFTALSPRRRCHMLALAGCGIAPSDSLSFLFMILLLLLRFSTVSTLFPTLPCDPYLLSRSPCLKSLIGSCFLPFVCCLGLLQCRRGFSWF